MAWSPRPAPVSVVDGACAGPEAEGSRRACPAKRRGTGQRLRTRRRRQPRSVAAPAGAEEPGPCCRRADAAEPVPCRGRGRRDRHRVGRRVPRRGCLSRGRADGAGELLASGLSLAAYVLSVPPPSPDRLQRSCCSPAAACVSRTSQSTGCCPGICATTSRSTPASRGLRPPSVTPSTGTAAATCPVRRPPACGRRDAGGPSASMPAAQTAFLGGENARWREDASGNSSAAQAGSRPGRRAGGEPPPSTVARARAISLRLLSPTAILLGLRVSPTISLPLHPARFELRRLVAARCNGRRELTRAVSCGSAIEASRNG